MSLQSILLLALIASGAIFVYFVCQLRKEGRELRETLTQALNCNDKHWAADGPRYKALGNSWAVPCARWIGQRIQLVENLLHV